MLNADYTFIYTKSFFNKYSNTLSHNHHKRLLLVLYIAILLLSTLINTILIYVICKVRNPRSLGNRRVLLARVVCDLLLAWFGIPYTAYVAVYRNWLLGHVMCKISTFVIYFLIALNNFLPVVICLNRSIAIIKNKHCSYKAVTTISHQVKCLLVIAVLFAIFIGLPGGLFSQQRQIHLPEELHLMFEFNSNLSTLIPQICEDSLTGYVQLTFDVVLIVSIYVIPLIVICSSQHIVYSRLKQSQRLLLTSGQQQTSLNWSRRRQRLTRLCAFMAILFVLSWTPNHICNILIKTFRYDHPMTEVLLDYSMCLALSNSLTGPILLTITCSNYYRYILRMFYCQVENNIKITSTNSIRSHLFTSTK